jgi:hypothetical protein
MMFVKFVLSVLDCHWIVPVLPERVSVVLFVPEQTEAAPLTVPATDTGFTVMVALAVFAGEQTPLVTTAL